jgi:queuine tRNA-ribosyltransferase
MQNSIKTKHGEIKLPAFMPDATYGAIRNLSFEDVKKSGIDEIVTTTLHLEQKLGSKYVKDFGGLHKFLGWDKPILTDSGGWQVFSLINSNKANKQNKITKLGCSFIDPASGKYNLLTPESSISIQYNLGADIMTVLDDPIIGDASLNARKESVDLTTNWARRSKEQFMKLFDLTNESFSKYRTLNTEYFEQKTESRKPKTERSRQARPDTSNEFESRSTNHETRPLLGAVIQGADDFEMRRMSAEQLLELDFDLYNFGGIPLYSDITWKKESPQGFYREMLDYVGSLIPNTKIKYAMGIGQPDDIAFCVEHGWHLFDTVLPTRNARHGYLYVSQGKGDVHKNYKSQITNYNYSYDVLHLKSERYKMDDSPVDENCNCECCKTVSRAYLRHLIRIGEPAGLRLATIHNLRFYAKWMETLRKFTNI